MAGSCKNCGKIFTCGCEIKKLDGNNYCASCFVLKKSTKK